MNPRQIMSNALSIFAWAFVRLPYGFSIPFIMMTVFWIVWGYDLVHDMFFFNQQGNDRLHGLAEFGRATGVVLLLAVGLIIAYNLSVLINWLLLKMKMNVLHFPPGEPSTIQYGGIEDIEFSYVNKIGIVLAGGGAKGAFQAGAMKAIYRYLDEKNALEKVKVIAGTSIGSWNALFWLADLIKPKDGWGTNNGKSTHQAWWESISVKSLIAPSWYVPFLRNSFLSTMPWRLAFNHMFKEKKIADRIASNPIHFYFTRSNVRSGQLTCATNNAQPVYIAGVTYEKLDLTVSGSIDTFMDSVGTSIFASMDLPPLFPYAHINGDVYEDGGVIDNVPIQFAATEGCDLILVLPLNSDFEEEPNPSSVFFRLFRVMDVRQGALERNGFKMVYLYNELAAVREYALKLQSQSHPGTSPEIPTDGGPLETALKRRNQHINVFAICPRREFARTTIGTHEFWKSKEAGEAFRVMEQATWQIVKAFNFGVRKDRVRMAVVSRGSNVTWDENF
jgi:NTE family protein